MDESVDEKGTAPNEGSRPGAFDRWRTHSQLAAPEETRRNEGEAGLVSTGVVESYDGHRQG